MTQFDKDKLAHESLLMELHNIDGIAETFARTAILINTALIAFISQVGTYCAICWISFFIGGLISGLMIFKAYRHRTIFVDCYKKIRDIEKNLKINAVREFPAGKKFLCYYDGFSLLGWLGIGFLLIWGAILLISMRLGFLIKDC